AEAGIEYICDWGAEDPPFRMRVKRGGMNGVPDSTEYKHIPAFPPKAYTPGQVHRMGCDEFDILYEEGAQSGRVMALALHPFITGHPHRMKWFEETVKKITSHD